MKKAQAQRPGRNFPCAHVNATETMDVVTPSKWHVAAWRVGRCLCHPIGFQRGTAARLETNPLAAVDLGCLGGRSCKGFTQADAWLVWASAVLLCPLSRLPGWDKPATPRSWRCPIFLWPLVRPPGQTFIGRSMECVDDGTGSTSEFVAIFEFIGILRSLALRSLRLLAASVPVFATVLFSSQLLLAQGALPKLLPGGTIGRASAGYSVALSATGDTAIVGGWGDNSYVGAVWVFTRTLGGVWSQQGSKLLSNDAVGPAYQGYSVALSADGNTALVGGANDNSGVGSGRGRASGSASGSTRSRESR